MDTKVQEDVDLTEVHETGEGNQRNRKKRQNRARKSKLYESIRSQMEFYFSDANLTKQRFMKETVLASEFVPLTIFIEKFNKLSLLSKNIDDVRRALKHSEKLELSGDGSGVKRKVNFDPNNVKDDQTVENCTIYVENIPPHVDHDWIEKIFLEFGQVAYVSLPKYKKSQKPKGFAFVEFENEESAKKCLEAFGEMGGCLPTTIDPSALLSITTFNDNTEEVPLKNQRKRTREAAVLESNGSPGEDTPKKQKSNPVVEAENFSGKKLPETSENQVESFEKEEALPLSTSEAVVAESGEDIGSGDGMEEEKSVEKRKKNRRKRKNIAASEEKLESDLIHLKVLPKRNWRQLRNRYLNLQRENFSKLKFQIRNYAKWDNSNRISEPVLMEGSLQASSKKYPSICIRVILSQLPDSRDSLVSQITTEIAPPDWSNFVKYVDYKDDKLEVMVRVDGRPAAEPAIESFLEKANSVFHSAVTLTEEESTAYWKSVRSELRDNKKAHIRGKDRLINQATKFANSHIRFQEVEDPNGVEGDEVKTSGPI